MQNKQLSTWILPGQQDAVKRLLQFFLLSMLIMLLGGGVALLLQARQAAPPGMASDVSVVGSPSLSAATADAVFRSLGSPMAGNGALILNLARQYHIDNAFALGVWWTETNDDEAGVGSADRNPGGVKDSPNYPHAYDGYTIYPSYAAGIADWFFIVQQRYISRGLTTVYSIAHPYVGTNNYPYWAAKVITQMCRYRGIAPPPTGSVPSAPKTQAHAPLVQKPLPARKIPIVPAQVRNKLLRLFTGEAMMASTAFQDSQQKSIQPSPLPDASTLPYIVQMAIVIACLLTSLFLALVAIVIGRSATLEVAPKPTPANTAPTAPVFIPSSSFFYGTPPTKVKPAWPVEISLSPAPTPPIAPIAVMGVERETQQEHGKERGPRRVVLLPAHVK